MFWTPFTMIAFEAHDRKLVNKQMSCIRTRGTHAPQSLGRHRNHLRRREVVALLGLVPVHDAADEGADQRGARVGARRSLLTVIASVTPGWVRCWPVAFASTPRGHNKRTDGTGATADLVSCRNGATYWRWGAHACGHSTEAGPMTTATRANGQVDATHHGQRPRERAPGRRRTAA